MAAVKHIHVCIRLARGVMRYERINLYLHTIFIICHVSSSKLLCIQSIVDEHFSLLSAQFTALKFDYIFYSLAINIALLLSYIFKYIS